MLDLLRRRLRIGIGGMMLAILFFGLWLGNRVNRAREQRTAVAAVKADNGFVLYADEFNIGSVKVPVGDAIWKPSWGTLIPRKGPTKPSLLQRWLGDEYVREVAHVSLFVDIEKGSAGARTTFPDPSTTCSERYEANRGSRPSIWEAIRSPTKAWLRWPS